MFLSLYIYQFLFQEVFHRLIDIWKDVVDHRIRMRVWAIICAANKNRFPSTRTFCGDKILPRIFKKDYPVFIGIKIEPLFKIFISDGIWFWCIEYIRSNDSTNKIVTEPFGALTYNFAMQETSIGQNIFLSRQ